MAALRAIRQVSGVPATAQPMSETSSPQVERRTGTRELVDKLMAERTQMLVLFCRCAGLEPYNERAPVAKVVQEFCQVLVDYIAAGHFALYDRVLNGTERRQEVLRLAEGLYPRIAATTEAAVAFNDKYDCGDPCRDLETLAADLSRLGEELAARIELEDRLIQALQRRG